MSIEDNNEATQDLPQEPTQSVEAPNPYQEAASILDELEEEVQQEKEPELALNREAIKQNTHIEFDPFSEGKNKHREEIFVTPPASQTEIAERLEAITDAEVLGKSDYRRWSTVLRQALPNTSFGAAGDNIFAIPGTEWVQRVKHNNVSIGQAGRKVVVEPGTVISGLEALSAINAHIGIGGNFTTVLPHSGIWVTLRPPGEETIIELYRQMNAIKTEVGRNSYGLLLSAHTGLVNELFARFAVQSMIRSSVKDVDDILSIISAHDINVLIWAFVCTIYPNGFNHLAPCIAQPTKCQHVVEDLINVRRLFFMDRSRLSDSMKDHLAQQSAASMSVEDVKKYRAELAEREQRKISLLKDTEEQIDIHLRVPSALEYFSATHKWINGMGDRVIAALGTDSSFNERNKLIADHAISTQMRKYTHWVESINVGGAIISGEEDIEKALDSLSVSKAVREEFDEQIGEYIQSTCLALIGIPDFKCPNCHEYQISDRNQSPLHRSIVAIDVPMVFFTILVQIVQSLEE